MTIRPVLTAPNPILREVSKPVTVFDDGLKALIADMFDSMYAEKGIGLAAVQIGEPVRLITMDLGRKDDAPLRRVFINPVLSDPSEELAPYEEGCLSVPEYYDEIMRPAEITVTFQDETGASHTERATGLFAVCIQHEMDHLEGKLFIDYLSKLRRDRALERVRKVVRGRQRM